MNTFFFDKQIKGYTPTNQRNSNLTNQELSQLIEENTQKLFGNQFQIPSQKKSDKPLSTEAINTLTKYCLHSKQWH